MGVALEEELGGKRIDAGEVVIPFTYANAINEQLKRDLGLTKTEFSLNEQGLNITMAVDLD